MQRQGQPIRLGRAGAPPDRKEGHADHGRRADPVRAALIATLLWVDLRNGYVWAVLCVTLGYGALGFADDYLKLSRRNHKGVSGARQADRRRR